MVGIILVTGKGSRMRSRLPKALHPICGKPLTRYVIDACKNAGIQDCIVVLGPDADQVQAGLGDDVRYIVQSVDGGTLSQALGGDISDVLLIPGDVPLITSEALCHLCEKHLSSGANATLLETGLDTDYKHSAIYCLNSSLLKQIKFTGEDGEYQLTTTPHQRLETLKWQDPDTAKSIKNRVDLASISRTAQRRILDRLMLDGVTIIDPNSTYIDGDVTIGIDTVIHPQSVIEKGCAIGEGCVIGPSARLSNVRLGNEVTVLFSNLVDSTIGDGTKIGPFAHVRPGCVIGKKVKLGDFVETKNAVLEDQVSLGHLAYIGDAVVGENTNVGAGAITCNYDGYTKHTTIIGKEVFLGSNVTVVAPVSIGDGALVAAGSTVTEDVPADALAIARCRQSVKEGWAKARREQKEK